MAFAGKWNKTAVEGGAAFFAACGIADDKLAAAEALVSTEVTEDGDNYCFNRTYGNGQTSTMSSPLALNPTSKVQLVQSRPPLPAMVVPSRPPLPVLKPLWKLSVVNWSNHGPPVVPPSSVCPANKSIL